MVSPATDCLAEQRRWLRLRHCHRSLTSLALKTLIDGWPRGSQPEENDQTLASFWEISQRALTTCDEDAVEHDIAWLNAAPRRTIVPFVDPKYPQLLRELPDPPMVLYTEGNPQLLATRQLAIVGSRNPTPSGREIARRLSQQLSEIGLTITSGLAIGIDTSAHEGCLSAHGHTIAVLANGLDYVYPASNTGLSQRIVTSGLLVSERPTGRRPTRREFPRRNRIISGLSVGTLVVEATNRSGSLITARLAGEQGREVYAVPGPIASPQSRGCHKLIRDGATLVESPADIFSELGPFRSFGGESEDETTPVESAVLIDSIGYDPVTIDTLVLRSGLTADTVCSMLLRLELQGVVTPMPGGHYIRTV